MLALVMNKCMLTISLPINLIWKLKQPYLKLTKNFTELCLRTCYKQIVSIMLNPCWFSVWNNFIDINIFWSLLLDVQDTPVCQLSVLWCPIPRIPHVVKYPNVQSSPQLAQCLHQASCPPPSRLSLEYWQVWPLCPQFSPLLVLCPAAHPHQHSPHLCLNQVRYWFFNYESKSKFNS